ncbi:MAG: DUF222 domain-containing protein, partial [Candidatus Nanopelagicales bacterium]
MVRPVAGPGVRAAHRIARGSSRPHLADVGPRSPRRDPNPSAIAKCALAEAYSATGAAWRAGGISRAHVTTITTAVDKVARGLAHDDQAPFRAAAEQALLAYALDGASPTELAIKAKRVRAWVDEWGLAKDADEAE